MGDSPDAEGNRSCQGEDDCPCTPGYANRRNFIFTSYRQPPVYKYRGYRCSNEDGNITVVDLLNNKEDYAKWKEMVGKQIDSAENAYQVFFLLNKPYYLTFLKFTAPVLSQEDLGQLLAPAWILEECPNQDRNVSKRELLALFRSVPPELLMDEEERAIYHSLDDPVTVYRGVTSYNAKNIKALSWTLDRVRRSGLPTALVRRAPSMRLRFQRNTFLPFSTAGMNQKS